MKLHPIFAEILENHKAVACDRLAIQTQININNAIRSASESRAETRRAAELSVAYALRKEAEHELAERQRMDRLEQIAEREAK